MKETEVVGEQVISEQNSFKRVKRYYAGWHPELSPLAVLTQGVTGKETIVFEDILYDRRKATKEE